MPTDTERRLELLENLLIAAVAGSGGAIVGAELQRFAPSIAPRAAPVGRLALAGAKKHPVLTVAALAIIAQQAGLSPAETAVFIAEEQLKQPQFFLQEQVKAAIRDPAAAKRKVSKANKAVKHAMGLLKAGTKASTGADKGKLPKGAFKTAVKAAGLANPRTPSRIKGKGRIKNLARKLKRWW